MTLYVIRPEPAWAGWFDELAAAGRAVEVPDGCCGVRPNGCRLLVDLFPAARRGDGAVAAGQADGTGDRGGGDAARAPGRVRAVHGGAAGPGDALGGPTVNLALIRLETEGFALRGRFTDPDGARSGAPGGC